MQARGPRLSLSHTCLQCSVDGQDGSPEQQGLLKEVVLVGVSPDASRDAGMTLVVSWELAGHQGSGGDEHG